MLLGQPDVSSFDAGRHSMSKDTVQEFGLGASPQEVTSLILLLTCILTKTKNFVSEIYSYKPVIKKKKNQKPNQNKLVREKWLYGQMNFSYLVLLIYFQNNIICLPLHLLCLHLLLLNIFKNKKLKFRAVTCFEWIVS